MDEIRRGGFLKVGTGLLTGITVASPSARAEPRGAGEVAPPTNPLRLELRVK
jgi:hypothetical protein